MTSVGNNWDYVVTLTEEQVIKKEYFPPFVISSTSEINIMTKPFSWVPSPIIFDFSAKTWPIWSAEINVWTQSCYARRDSYSRLALVSNYIFESSCSLMQGVPKKVCYICFWRFGVEQQMRDLSNKEEWMPLSLICPSLLPRYPTGCSTTNL